MHHMEHRDLTQFLRCDAQTSLVDIILYSPFASAAGFDSYLNVMQTFSTVVQTLLEIISRTILRGHLQFICFISMFDSETVNRIGIAWKSVSD